MKPQTLHFVAAFLSAAVINSLGQSASADAKLTIRRSSQSIELSRRATTQKSDSSIVRPVSIKERGGNLRLANLAAAVSGVSSQQPAANPAFSFWFWTPGTENLGHMPIGVYRGAALDKAVTVHYETTSEGTAIPGQDFVPTSGDLVFAAGEQFKSIQIPYIDDGLVEGVETIGVRLTDVGGSLIESFLLPWLYDNEIPVSIEDSSFQPDIPLTERALPLPDGGFLEVVLDRPASWWLQSKTALLMRLDANGRLKSFLGQFGRVTQNLTGPEDPDFGNLLSGFAFHSLAGGAVLVTGRFQTFNSTTNAGLIRLNADLSLDAGFSVPELRGSLREDLALLMVQRDGRLLVRVGSARIVRLLDDGRLDTSFQETKLEGPLTAYRVTMLEDGENRLLLGLFGKVNEFDQVALARLNPDGSLDQTFRPTFQAINTLSARVSEVFLLPGGKILIAGSFTTVNGAPRVGLVRLNQDGSLDEALKSAIESEPLLGLWRMPGDKFLLSGNLKEASTGQRMTTARINADGTLDASFHADPSAGFVWALLSDGRLLAGGDHEEILLQADGSRDPKFLGVWPASGNRMLVEQADGRVVLFADVEDRTGNPWPGGRFFIRDTPRSVFSLVGDWGAVVRDGSFVFEGLDGDTTLYFTIRRSGDTTEPASVRYEIHNGTLVGGKDFTPVSGTANFAAREVEKTLSIQLLGGASDRFGTLQIQLTESAGAEVVSNPLTWANFKTGSGWIPPTGVRPLTGGTTFFKTYGYGAGSVEASSDLKAWSAEGVISISPRFTDSIPAYYYLDTNPGFSLHRFYRVAAKAP